MTGQTNPTTFGRALWRGIIPDKGVILLLDITELGPDKLSPSTKDDPSLELVLSFLY